MKCQHCGSPAKRIPLSRMRVHQDKTWEEDPDDETHVVLIDSKGYACCLTCWRELKRGEMLIPTNGYHGRRTT